MTPDQGTRILAALTAVWPNAFGRDGMSEPTVRAWLDNLRDLSFEASEEAVKRVAAEDDRFPSYSRFRGVAKDEERRMEARAQRERLERALPPAPMPPDIRERGRREVQAIKEKLRGQT